LEQVGKLCTNARVWVSCAWQFFFFRRHVMASC
jgi:hypothetical protein